MLYCSVWYFCDPIVCVHIISHDFKSSLPCMFLQSPPTYCDHPRCSCELIKCRTPSRCLALIDVFYLCACRQVKYGQKSKPNLLSLAIIPKIKLLEFYCLFYKMVWNCAQNDSKLPITQMIPCILIFKAIFLIKIF